MQKSKFGAVAAVVSLLGVAFAAAPAAAGGCGYNDCGGEVIVVRPQPIFPSCGCGAASYGYGGYGYGGYGYAYGYGGYGYGRYDGYGGYGYPEYGYRGYGYPGYGYRGIGYRGIGYRGIGYRGVGYRGIHRGFYRPAFHGGYRVGRWR